MKRKNSKILPVVIGLVSALAIFFLLGIPTDILENQFYMRMIPSSLSDMLFLIITSLLIGIYASLASYLFINKKKDPVSSGRTMGGIFGSFFAISCPICVKFLVWIFGTTFLLTYYDPLRPAIGLLSLGLIGLGIYNSIQIINGRCDECIAIKTTD